MFFAHPVPSVLSERDQPHRSATRGPREGEGPGGPSDLAIGFAVLKFPGHQESLDPRLRTGPPSPRQTPHHQALDRLGSPLTSRECVWLLVTWTRLLSRFTVTQRMDERERGTPVKNGLVLTNCVPSCLFFTVTLAYSVMPAPRPHCPSSWHAATCRGRVARRRGAGTPPVAACPRVFPGPTPSPSGAAQGVSCIAEPRTGGGGRGPQSKGDIAVPRPNTSSQPLAVGLGNFPSCCPEGPEFRFLWPGRVLAEPNIGSLGRCGRFHRRDPGRVGRIRASPAPVLRSLELNSLSLRTRAPLGHHTSLLSFLPVLFL